MYLCPLYTVYFLLVEPNVPHLLTKQGRSEQLFFFSHLRRLVITYTYTSLPYLAEVGLVGPPFGFLNIGGYLGRTELRNFRINTVP